MNWQPMTSADMAAVKRIADRVYLNYPEDEGVFLERLRLFPEGCFILKDDFSTAGYIISHPWHYKQPPNLNTLIEEIPPSASTFYIHDIAFLPQARGKNAASIIIDKVVDDAVRRHLPNVSLVAVNNSKSFWEHFGFKAVDDPSLSAKLASYDAKARFMVRELSR